MAKKKKRIKRKPGSKLKRAAYSRGRKPSSRRRAYSRGRAVKKKVVKRKRVKRKPVPVPAQPSFIQRFLRPIIIPLSKYYQEDVPNWNIDNAIAKHETTFLLYYKDGLPLELNVRLQFHHATYTHNANVDSRDKLLRELIMVIRDSKTDVETEMKYLTSLGIPTSVLFYDCASYHRGNLTPPEFIEILYQTNQ